METDVLDCSTEAFKLVAFDIAVVLGVNLDSGAGGLGGATAIGPGGFGGANETGFGGFEGGTKLGVCDFEVPPRSDG